MVSIMVSKTIDLGSSPRIPVQTEKTVYGLIVQRENICLASI